MRFLLASTLILSPAIAFAVGSDDKDDTPAPTETTTTCENGMVWSEAEAKCVAPEESSLSDDVLYKAVRELAYAGRYVDTLRVLDAMSDPADDRVLTYKGFVYRNMGDTELGYSYYRQAIAANPDNLLARSYMGQGMVLEQDYVGAANQLKEIRLRGGQGTWPEIALAQAIDTGIPSSY